MKPKNPITMLAAVQWASRNTWNSVGTGIATSVSNPYLQTYLYYDGDRHQTFGTATRRASAADLEAVGLDAQYVNWDLTTTFNSGDAQVKGVELSAKHSLRGITSWGQYFSVFANATRLWLDGNPGANFSTFLPKSANWGFSFNRKRVGLTARWNFRGLDTRTPIVGFGDDGYLKYTDRTVLDLSFSYQLTRRLSFVSTYNNATNEHIQWRRYGVATPEYARQWEIHDYGALFTIGINGKF